MCRDGLGSRSGSFRRTNERTLIKLLSEGQVKNIVPILGHVRMVVDVCLVSSSRVQIAPQDLQYLEILGHGSGGTVYRYIMTSFPDLEGVVWK